MTDSTTTSTGSLHDYLTGIEAASRDDKLGDFLLWPSTPLGDQLQNQIKAMVGVSDLDPENPKSRPAIVTAILSKLREAGELGERFTMLDVLCGDARILIEVKKVFRRARLAGLDCQLDKFETHAQARRQGIRLYGGFVQRLFASTPRRQFDVVMMLNTFRSWDNATLRGRDHQLPKLAEQWLFGNARFTIVTAHPDQIARLKKSTAVEEFGKGEENSRFLLVRNMTGAAEMQARMDNT